MRAAAKKEKVLKQDAYNEKRRKRRLEGNTSMKMNDDVSNAMPVLETVAEVPQQTLVLTQTKGTSENTQTNDHGQSR